MKSKITYILTFCFAMVYSSSVCQTDDNLLQRSDLIREVLSKEISKILNETGIPSISIALVSNDKILFQEAYGYANYKKKVLATSSSIYNTGSNFKFVTAIAIMKLAEEGKLDIDDPINLYLDDDKIEDLSGDGTPVTFRHLLSHHSGLRGTIEIVPLWDRAIPSNLSTIASKVVAVEEPGKKFEYCNHCYALLGLAIEKISGQSFQEYIVTNILEPLGIKNDSPLTPSPGMVEELVLPYTLVNNKPIPESQIRINNFPAGDMYMTVPDMAKFLLVQLNNGKINGKPLLTPSSISEMLKSQYGSYYGLGTGILTQKEGKVYTHTGGLTGFSSYYKVWPEPRVGIYLAANCGESHEVLDAISSLSYQLLTGAELTPLKSFSKKVFEEIEISPESLNIYPGTYQLRPGMNITISLEENQLYALVTGQSKNPIFPFDRHKFFFKIAFAQIEFNINDNKVESLTLHQNGQHITAEKKE